MSNLSFYYIMSSLLAISGSAVNMTLQNIEKDCKTKCCHGPITAINVQPRQIIWDADFCPEGQSYIHNVGSSAGAEMTAGAGETTHTYTVADFVVEDGEDEQLKNLHVGGCGRTPTGGTNTKTWKITRKDSPCPTTPIENGNGR